MLCIYVPRMYIEAWIVLFILFAKRSRASNVRVISRFHASLFLSFSSLELGGNKVFLYKSTSFKGKGND